MIRQAPDEKAALMWTQAYPFVALVIPVSLHFALLYTRKKSFYKKKWMLAALYISVFVISASMLFDNYMFESITKKPWGYAPVLAPDSVARNVAILWLVIINSCTIFLILYHRALTHDQNKKRQTSIVAVGLIAPVVSANISQFFLPIFGVEIPELTTAGILMQTSLIGFAIWKYDLFSLNPATAANNIVATISDIFILLDPEGKMLFVNKAMTDLLEFDEQDLIQKPIERILSKDVTEQFLLSEAKTDKFSPKTSFNQGPIRNLEGIFVTKSGKETPTSVAVSTLVKRNGSIAGHVVVARDITEQKQIASERENLINELQDALANIKALRGLLPICANCKKIRDDEGYWNQIESYLSKHSDAEFTHSMCPECSEKFYGKEAWYQKLKKEKGIK